MPLISSLEFASCYTYSPKGGSAIAKRSRDLRDWLKSAHRPSLKKMANRVCVLFENNTFDGFFGHDVVLMPVPGSKPLTDSTNLWTSKEICETLIEKGLADSISFAARRKTGVPKSAYQSGPSRPNAKKHYDSINLSEEIISPKRLLLVDDIVTKGNTMLGCASRVRERFPKAEIKAFAMLRTMGLEPDIDKILDPCTGLISLDGNEAVRSP